jgi:hypothetical protein
MSISEIIAVWLAASIFFAFVSVCFDRASEPDIPFMLSDAVIFWVVCVVSGPVLPLICGVRLFQKRYEAMLSWLHRHDRTIIGPRRNI